MSTPNPDLVGLIDAMIAWTYTDLQNPGGYLRPTLDAYGVTIDLTPYVDPLGILPGDPAMYKGLVFGDPDPADGCSIHFVPTPVEEELEFAPNEASADYLVLIRAIWKDNPDQVMQSSNRRYWRFLTRFTSALQVLFGMNALGARYGRVDHRDRRRHGADVPDGGSRFGGGDWGQIRLQGELEFTCHCLFKGP